MPNFDDARRLFHACTMGVLFQGNTAPQCPSQRVLRAKWPKEKIKMQNIEMQVTGSILTLKVDLSKRNGRSKSGKTVMIASSEGNKAIPGTAAVLGINIYTKED